MLGLRRKVYKYHLYPSIEQREKLQWTLGRVRELYNASLQERRDAYESAVRRHPNFYDEESRKQFAKAHAIKPKALDERWHSCPCGTELDRDHNSARAILRIGLTGEPIHIPRKKKARARTEPSEDAPLRSLRL